MSVITKLASRARQSYAQDLEAALARIAELVSDNQLVSAELTQCRAELAECQSALTSCRADCDAAQVTIADLKTQLAAPKVDDAIVESQRNDIALLKAQLSAANEECKRIPSLALQLHAAELQASDLSARLEAERAERERSDQLLRSVIAQFKDVMTMEEEHEVEVGESSPPEWEFRIQRDGANQMIGVVAKQRSGNG